MQPYRGSGAPQRISPRGGREPVWSRDGRELFYLEGDWMIAVSVGTDGGTLRLEPPVKLFDDQYPDVAASRLPTTSPLTDDSLS